MDKQVNNRPPRRPKNTLAPEVEGTKIGSAYSLKDAKPITPDELIGSEVGIRQLMYNYKQLEERLEGKEIEISNLKAENEYLKTSPFIAGVSGLINAVGTAITSFGVSFLSTEKPPEYSGWIFWLGISTVCIGILFPIFYPKARGWFNKKNTTT